MRRISTTMSSLLRRVCLYLGEGADEKNAAVILALLKHYLHSKDVDVSYISPEETIEGTWRKSSLLYVIGGGYDLGFIAALGDVGTQQIRDYVLEGGSYLGICAGAYFASDHIEFDKGGPLEVCGERKLKFYPGLSVGPVYGPYNYTTKSGARAAKITFGYDSDTSEGHHDNSKKLKQLDFKCFFNGGGMFLPYNAGKPIIRKICENRNFTTDLCNLENKLKSEKVHLSSEIKIDENDGELSVKGSGNIEKPHSLSLEYKEDNDWCKKGDNSITVQVLANYQEIIGSPACIVKTKVGKGTAVLSGLHIEYSSCSMDGTNVFLKLVQDEISKCDNEQNLCFGALLKHLGLF